MKASEVFMNMISPPRCHACNRRMSVYTNAMFCYDCSKTYHKINGPTCKMCGKPINVNADDTCVTCKGERLYYNKNVSRYVYSGCVADAIRNMKFKRRRWIAQSFGRVMVDTVKVHYSDIAFDGIVYVPMTKLSEYTRGFNQSFDIALEISEKLNIPIIDNVLNKNIGVKTQSGLNRNQRRDNVKGAFFISKPERLIDKTILLIDDVHTTGSTLNECAKMLKKSGAVAVYCATVARSIFDE